MKTIKVYEAGAMGNISFEEQVAWRVDLKCQLELQAQWADCICEVCNPVEYYNFKNPRHQSELEVMKFDLARVKESDVVVVNLDNFGTSDGSKIEVYTAWINDIPVIAMGTDGQYESLHPWLKNCMTRLEHTDTDVAIYIKNFYMES